MKTTLSKEWHFYSGKVADKDEFSNFRLFAGTSNPELCKEVSNYLGLPLDAARVGSFRDGEVDVEIKTEVRGKDVFVLQSVCKSADRSVNDSLMELLLLISAIRRASAMRITAIIPYYGYARQDRKMAGRVPISAADVATMLTAMGVDRVCSVDLHCGQIQGFFPPKVPMDNLNAGPIGAAYFSERKLVRPIVVSPDAGGVGRAKDFRSMLEKKGYKDTGLAMIIKQRSGASKIERMDLVGSVKGSDVIIVDDMVDTAGTLCKAAKVLKDAGALSVHAFCTHGLFSGSAPDNVANSVLDSMVVCNTIPLSPQMAKIADKMVVLNIAPILAEMVKRLHSHSSLMKIFSSPKSGSRSTGKARL